MEERDLIFISHAQPEDNELTRWLCGRLTARGYKVWADITELRGGERFWTNIQEVIRNRAARVLVLVTKTSINRDGVKNEIAEASDVGRKIGESTFIIPIKADDIEWADFPIQLKQLNGLDFSNGWTSDFPKLLKALEIAKVPVSVGDTEVARVASALESTASAILDFKERALLNWYEISRLPNAINCFHTSLSASDLSEMAAYIKVPHVSRDRLLLTFADAPVVESAVPEEVETELRYTIPLKSFLSGQVEHGPRVKSQEASNYVTSIVRQAFEGFLEGRGLLRHDYRWYIPRGWRDDDEAHYTKVDGKPGYRQLVGKAKNLVWHMGLAFHVKLQEPRRIQLVPQVLFSADGLVVLEDQKQYRRRHCKLWWNDKWRDLLLAVSAEMFGRKAKYFDLSLGGSAVARIRCSPRSIELPVSYAEDAAYLPDIEEDLEDWGEEYEWLEQD